MRKSLALIALAIALCIGASPAGAREYVVHTCKLPDGTAAPTDGWKANGSAPYMWFDDACARGGALTAGLAGIAQPANSSAIGWGFSSGDATIRGYRIVRSGTPRGFNGGASMLVYSADAQNTTGTGRQIDYCAAYRGCAGIAGLLARSVPAIPTDSRAWYFTIVCGGGAGEQCGLAPGASDFGSLRIDQASFTLDDPEQPGAQNIEGALAREGAAFGELRLVATDRISGVRRAVAEIDGAEVATATPEGSGSQCSEIRQSALPDFTHRRPCPERAQLALVVPRSAVLPGTHTLRVRVFDAAGNATTVVGPREVSVGTLTGRSASGFAADGAENLTANYGRRLRIGGVLLGSSGEPLQAAQVDVAMLSPAASRPKRQMRILTDAAGRYAVSFRATSSRSITLTHAATGSTLAHRLTVRSRVRLAAAAGRVRPLGRMRLRGSIQTERTKKGASVAIKVKSGRAWKTIGVARASQSGRFSFAYKFRRTRSARFIFRAVVLRSSDLAVSPRASNAVRVRVG